MKIKNRILILPLILAGLIFVFINSCKKDNNSDLFIGDSYQGGKVAYILAPGNPGYDVNVKHGLIAAPSDQSSGIKWWNGTSVLTDATATGYGSGKANTNSIVTIQGNGDYAAKLCSDLVLASYSDWYLPSKDELSILYTNRLLIGPFADAQYWSSSEVSIGSALLQGFSSGIQGGGGKGVTAHVRAVRSF